MRERHYTMRYYMPRPSAEVEFFEALGHVGAFRPVEERQEGHIYVLQAGEFYKIGRAKEFPARLKQLEIQLPFPARLVIAFEATDVSKWEAAFHFMFKDRRANGEWFRLNSGDVDKLFRLARLFHDYERKRP